MKPIFFKTSLNAGDLMANLPGIRQMWLDTGRMAIICQTIGREVKHPNVDNHPVANEAGHPVTMSMGMFNGLKPLLDFQPYIEKYEVYNGQPIDIDLDKPREYNLSIIPFAPLHFYSQMIFPQMAADLSTPWINSKYTQTSPYANKIIINRTDRYNNPHLDFFFLKKYERNIVIVGTPEECNNFRNKWDLNCAATHYVNFMDLAVDLYQCKFMFGNQSFIWHLANAMAIPRILEICDQYPNTWPTTKNGYPVLFQDALEYYFNYLWKS